MHALNGRSGRKGRRAGVVASSAAGSAHGAFVLPRYLRKPFRLAKRLFGGGVTLPRHLGTVGFVVLFGATGLYGMVTGGHTDEVVKVTASTFGFAIETVNMSGNSETSDIDILQALNLDGETSLVGFDVEDARQAVAKLPWVESVEIRKSYPGTVEISLVERNAFAVWQSGDDLMLVDAHGEVIVPLNGSRYASLPLVVGEGAQKSGKDFIEVVAGYPELAAKVRAYARVSDRRWDLLFDNGVRVLLPELDVKRALAEVEELDRSRNLLSRDILAVDMRLDDRVTIQLTASGVEQREKMLKEREKLSARTGRRV